MLLLAAAAAAAAAGGAAAAAGTGAAPKKKPQPDPEDDAPQPYDAAQEKDDALVIKKRERFAGAASRVCWGGVRLRSARDQARVLGAGGAGAGGHSNGAAGCCPGKRYALAIKNCERAVCDLALYASRRRSAAALCGPVPALARNPAKHRRIRAPPLKRLAGFRMRLANPPKASANCSAGITGIMAPFRCGAARAGCNV